MAFVSLISQIELMSKVEIEGVTGYGLMSLTWGMNVPTYKTAFATIKNAIDEGVHFLNLGEFYNMPDQPEVNLRLIQAFFEKYPYYISKVVISVKGAFDSSIFKPDLTAEGIQKSIMNIASYFPDHTFDLFEPARMDPSVEVEDVIKRIIPFVETGVIRGISLSEVNAKTIRRANAVYPISAVEVEFSIFSKDILTNGVAETCAELGIPIVAYSPLARGFLTGSLKTASDLAAEDPRNMWDRFQGENFEHNLKIAAFVNQYAEQLRITPAQFALNWIRKFSTSSLQIPRILPIPSSSNPTRNSENNKVVDIPNEIFDKFNVELNKFEVKGGRYNKMLEGHLNL